MSTHVPSPVPTEGAPGVALFGGGCFWCLDAVFRELKGVTAVESGYAGGKTANPNYEDICTGRTGHAEVVRITFDPSLLSFRDLLTVFFTIHDPTTVNRQGNDVGTQYRSAIFFHNEDQRKIAERVLAEVDKSGRWPAKVVTQIVPAATFYPAEGYHQDYLQKNPGGYTCHYVRD